MGMKGSSNRLNTPAATMLLWLLAFGPMPSWADVSGIWDTTGLSRIVVSPVLFPGSPPERTVEIGDGNYDFGAGNAFTAGDIVGTWKQRRGSYSVRPDRAALETAYEEALLNSEEPPVVNKIRLLRSKIVGSELDNGIWGTETYVYRLDLGEGAERQILRVTMTVRVAGHRQNPALTAQRTAASSPSLAELAAAAVLRYRRNHPTQ